MEWQPIERGEITVLETSLTPGLITAETTLTRTPPDSEWLSAFHSPVGVTRKSGIRLPRLFGDKIAMDISRADELESMVQYVDGAIAWANKSYADRVVPRIQREEEQRAEQERAQDAEIAKARDIAKGL